MRPHNWHDYRRHFKPHWQRNRRFIFWRFALIFGGISVFFLLGIGVILYLVFGQTPNYSPITLLAIICPAKSGGIAENSVGLKEKM